MSARKEINKQLYDAVKRNEVETVTCLVRRGADVNARGGTLVCVVSSNVCIVYKMKSRQNRIGLF